MAGYSKKKNEYGNDCYYQVAVIVLHLFPTDLEKISKLFLKSRVF